MAALGTGALEGLRVLDLTQALAGPFCTQILADHGADVVKVETPSGGDLSRYAGPYHTDDQQHRHSGYFHSINRNKKSIVLDLKTKEGCDILRRLVADFDVVVENFRTGVMDRLGLSYESLRERNPRLVYAAVRGFGDPRSGASPYVDWPAFDVVAQAMGGIMGITGPDREHPTKIGPGIGDTIPALYLAIGILAAVMRARMTGRGQFVDVAMLDAILAINERTVYQHSFAGKVAGPEGNHHPFLVPFGIFPARDGHVSIACPSDHFFRDLCDGLGMQDFAATPEAETVHARMANRQHVIEAVSARTATFTKAELKARLGGRVPFGPIYDMAEIAEDLHFTSRGMLADIECPGINETLRIAGVPVKFSETPGSVARRGPDHGEHTDEVLKAAGFAAADIDRWRSAGIIK